MLNYRFSVLKWAQCAGPLLFHFAEMSDPSLELSHDEIMDIVRQIGFTVEVCVRGSNYLLGCLVH